MARGASPALGRVRALCMAVAAAVHRAVGASEAELAGARVRRCALAVGARRVADGFTGRQHRPGPLNGGVVRGAIAGIAHAVVADVGVVAGGMRPTIVQMPGALVHIGAFAIIPAAHGGVEDGAR